MAAGTGALRLNGHLQLVCARGADGRGYLREQSFRAPMHISKPWWEDGLLVVSGIGAVNELVPSVFYSAQGCMGSVRIEAFVQKGAPVVRRDGIQIGHDLFEIVGHYLGWSVAAHG